jgi:hypothetical protein
MCLVEGCEIELGERAFEGIGVVAEEVGLCAVVLHGNQEAEGIVLQCRAVHDTRNIREMIFRIP